MRNNDIGNHLTLFRDYAQQKISACNGDAGPMLLKKAHTFHVHAHAGKIAAEEGLAPDLERVALLGSLYHDIARFDQYLAYGTFKDAVSFNHGFQGAHILRNVNWLDNEPAEIRRLTILSVGLHNRKSLPDSLSPRQMLVCNIIRDADKLDILRVMDGHLARRPYNPTVILSLPDDESLHNPVVARDALAGKCASYEDLASVNDFRLLLGSWFFSLNFAASRNIFLEEGHGRNLVESLPDNEFYGEVRTHLLRNMKTYYVPDGQVAGN